MSNKVISLETAREELAYKEKMLGFIDQQIEADANSVQPLPQSLFTEINALLLSAEEAKKAAEVLEG
jgi:hypothetical protein